MTDKIETGGTTSRRTVLRLVGAGAGVGMVSGLGAAKRGDKVSTNGNDGNNGNDPKDACECDEGYTYVKRDGVPVEGETYTFGDVSITITKVEYEDDEEVGFEFTSSDDIEKICVKGGPEVRTTTDLSGWVYAPDNDKNDNRDYYQISNIAVCGRPPTLFQADLVVGYPICEFDPDGGVTYTMQGRRLTSRTCEYDGEILTMVDDANPTDQGDDQTGGSVVADCFDTQTASSYHTIDCQSDGTLVGNWVGNNCSDLIISLAVYRIEQGYGPSDLEHQTLVACEVMTGVSSGTGSISVNIKDDCAYCV